MTAMTEPDPLPPQRDDPAAAHKAAGPPEWSAGYLDLAVARFISFTAHCGGTEKA